MNIETIAGRLTNKPLSQSDRLLEIKQVARIEDWDNAQADAVLTGLVAAGFFAVGFGSHAGRRRSRTRFVRRLSSTVRP